MDKHFDVLQFNDSIKKYLQDVCRPLETNLQIKLLAFRRFYDTGKLLYVFNHDQWMHFSLENEWWHSRGFSKRVPLLKTVNYLNYYWPENPPDDKLYQSLYDLKIRNGVVMYKRYNQYTESYAFFSHDDQIAKEIYHKHLYLLENFIVYYRSKMQRVFEKANDGVYIDCAIDYLPDTQNTELKQGMHAFLHEVQNFNSYLLNFSGGDICLSKRELDCLLQFMKGNTAKETARELDISSRTVESHIVNIRRKADVCRNSEVLDALFDELGRYCGLKI